MESWSTLACRALMLCNKHVQNLHSKIRIATIAGDEIPSPVTPLTYLLLIGFSGVLLVVPTMCFSSLFTTRILLKQPSGLLL